MATFSFEVSPYRRRDGTYLVKIRMTHRRKVIRKPSGIYATAEQLTRDKTRIRDASLLDAVNAAVDRIRMAAARVDGGEFMEAAELWRHVTRRMEAEKGFALDFRAFSEAFTVGMKKGTADGYKYATRAFFTFLGRDTCDVNEIDKAMVRDFREWLERRHGKGCRCASAYLEKLRAIHNHARDTYNDDDTGLVRIPRQPFKDMIPAQPSPRHRALTLDQLRRVWEVEPPTQRAAVGLAAFKLSFMLVGMNTVDLYELRKGDLRGDLLIYHRHKTADRRDDKAVMTVRVEPEAAAMIAEWKGSRTLLSFADRYTDFKAFNKYANKGLKVVGELACVDGLQTYHARHTWATLARNACKIDKDTVHEALNHASRGSDKVTDIYVERDFSRVWDANRKVLDLLFGK